MSSKRFRIAFSFAGEKRDFVKQVAALLAKRFGLDAILYDKYHEAEFARRDLGIYLPELYHKQSDFVVVVACPDYDVKQWTGLEWTAIHDLLSHRKHEEVMLCRFDHANVTGLYSTAGFVELDDKTPEQFVILILERLALNEGNPRDHYLSASSPSSFVIPHSSLPVLSNLPGMYANCLFVGRDSFLDDLRASLLKKTHATAITQAPAATGISGLGGIGKTHAAVEYARLHQADYSAQLFISGGSPERLSAGFSALYEVLQLGIKDEVQRDESIRVTAVLKWLASHDHWLLIVDNVDDEAAAAALAGYFGQLSKGHVLITTCLQNWADNVETLRIGYLSLDASIELLLQLTDKKRRRTDDEAAQVRQLADRMDGLPLALHQAAGYINEQSLTFRDYIAIYEKEATDLLGWFKSHVIHYERLEKDTPKPVLITWKTSFDKLDEDTRFWLLVFSHFAPDPIPEFLLENADQARASSKSRFRRILEAVFPFLRPRTTARQALAHAETYSLLTRYDDPPRFKLHRLVQHIIHLTALEADCADALAMGIQLIEECDPGDPQDVRTWPRWTPLQAHAVALAAHAPDAPVPERLTWLLNTLGVLLNTKSLYSQAEPYFRRALKLDEASYGPDHPRVAIDLNNLAQFLHATNRLAEAEPLMRRALDIDEASYGPDHPRVAIDHINLAGLLQDTNRLAEAEPLMRRALGIDEASYGPDHPRVAIDHSNLAGLLQATNRLAEAEPLMRRALGIDEASFGPDHPNVARDLNNLATLLQATNRLAEAEPLMRRALGIDEASYGPDHPKVAIRLNNLATLLKDRNRLAEAEPLMRRALEIDEACYGPGHPNVAMDLNNLATLLQATNRLAEAEPLMRRALDIDEASYGPDHPMVASRLNNIALLLEATNRLAEAEPLMRRALGIDEASYGPDHPDVAIDLNNLAMLLQVTNRLAEAELLYRRALDIDEVSYGPDHPKVAIRLNNLATLLKDRNRLAEAEPLMRRALDIDEASYGPGHPRVAIHLNNLAALLQATNRLAEAEPLMRRALDIDEASYGPDHPNVAIRLNNLAELLQLTNRLAGAEPLMRRALGIFVRSRGLEHPHSQTVRGNYTHLLKALKLPKAEIRRRVLAAMDGSRGTGAE